MEHGKTLTIKAGFAPIQVLDFFRSSLVEKGSLLRAHIFNVEEVIKGFNINVLPKQCRLFKYN